MAKACLDAFVVSLRTYSPEEQVIQSIKRPRAHRPKQLRFHFAKVETNSAFGKHSSEWKMHNNMHIHGGWITGGCISIGEEVGGGGFD
ncbi:hypothetical protein CDAR_171841 [Caerostris darwini]|uniref:Uncharacterized protein n=1 Tax=Caerostris darwini TaxID=1538125 RepID=A0AAV4MMK5_9ARAC|nr:hypothetical protein CDAR_171841 [Caerostris darwini]